MARIFIIHLARHRSRPILSDGQTDLKCDAQLSSYSGQACTQQQLLHSCDLFTDTSGSGGERV